MNPRPIGDRKLSLATHLRAAVDLLLDEANTTYNWSDYGQCSCGLLARCIVGLTVLDIRKHVLSLKSKFASKHEVGWSRFADAQTCPVTGDTTDVILAQLFAAGLLLEDIEHVEFLNHPALAVERLLPSFLGYLVGTYRDRKNAAAYLLHWAQAIEAFHTTKKAFHVEQEQLANRQPVGTQEVVIATQ